MVVSSLSLVISCTLCLSSWTHGYKLCLLTSLHSSTLPHEVYSRDGMRPEKHWLQALLANQPAIEHPLFYEVYIRDWQRPRLEAYELSRAPRIAPCLHIPSIVVSAQMGRIHSCNTMEAALPFEMSGRSWMLCDLRTCDVSLNSAVVVSSLSCGDSVVVHGFSGRMV